MATLDISEKGKNIEEPEDESKFIYDFDSESSLGSFEEEEPQVGLVKIDNPEPSDQGRKRGRRDGKEEFIDQQIIQDKMDDRKFRHIPSKYIPTINRHKEDDVLDIDCSDDTEKELRDWYHNNMVTIQLDSTLKNLSPKSIFNYLKTKTVGNAWKFISENPDPALPSTTEEVINYVIFSFKKGICRF
jgi:hypothetical protein